MRFGAGRMVSAGLALTGISAAIGLMGLDVAHFWVTLVLLGLGWNFGFVGASAWCWNAIAPRKGPRCSR